MRMVLRVLRMAVLAALAVPAILCIFLFLALRGLADVILKLTRRV